jgi:hypothetical protein
MNSKNNEKTLSRSESPTNMIVSLKLINFDEALDIEVKTEEDASGKNLLKYVLLRNTRCSFEDTVDRDDMTEKETHLATKAYFKYVISNCTDIVQRYKDEKRTMKVPDQNKCTSYPQANNSN